MGMRMNQVRVAIGAVMLFAAAGALAATKEDAAFGSGGAGGSSASNTSGSVNTTLSGALPGGGGGGGGNNLSNSSSYGVQRFALDKGETGKAGAGLGSKWNAWLSLSQSNVANKFQPLSSSGRVNLELIGVDYTFGNNLIVGLAAGWDQTRIGTSFNSGNIKGDGNIVAPYLSWRFAPSWNFDATLGAGRARINQVDNSVPGSITGNYTDRRALGSLSVSYARLVGKWQLTGRGSYLAAQDRLDQFTLSNGTTIAGTTNKTGQVRVGGQAMYNGGVFLPYFGLYYFNDVQRVSIAQTGGQTPANDRDGFQAQLGIQFAPRGPVYGGLMIASDFGRRESRNDLFLGNIGIRF